MSEEPLIAVFVDFENLALGVRDMKWGAFRVDLVLKRLLEKGRIVEQGRHAELLAKNGLYASLWARQREADEAREILAHADEAQEASELNGQSEGAEDSSSPIADDRIEDEVLASS